MAIINFLNKIAVSRAKKDATESGLKLTSVFTGDAFKRDEKGKKPEPLVPKRRIDSLFERHPEMKRLAMSCIGSLTGMKGSELAYDAGRGLGDRINEFQERLTEGLEANNQSLSQTLNDPDCFEALKNTIHGPSVQNERISQSYEQSSDAHNTWEIAGPGR